MEETQLVITELIWDDWNVAHVAHHNVTPENVEQSLADEHAVFIKAKLGRVMVLGRSSKRLIATVLSEQETSGAYYVVTARDMSKKERTFYRAQKETSHE
jgi:uncharacterized DUF497 family protein